MNPTTPSPTPVLLDRCNEIAQQEAALREGSGAAGHVRQLRDRQLALRTSVPLAPVSFNR